MTSFDLTAQRTKILELLTEAGTTGLSKTGLVKNKRAQEALQQLAEEGQVKDRGTARGRYVLAVHYLTPLEMADEIIRQRAMATNKNPIVLLSLTQLLEKLPAGPVKKEGDNALRLLVQEGFLVPVKWTNVVRYFPRQLLAPIAPLPSEKEIQWEQIVQAYQQLVLKTQFSYVRIADLHQLLGKPDLEKLKEILLDACRRGIAIPGEGDLSLVATEGKTAVLNIAGHLHPHIHIVQ